LGIVVGMKTTHPYFRPTTASQRRLLFETWAATGNVAEASRKARVSRDTFYYWKPRFDEGGAEGLEQTESHAPQSPHKTAENIEKQVIEMRHEHREWGKRRIADELAKANTWRAVISPNTVRRILEEAGLWFKPAAESQKEGAKQPTVRTADKPGQTVNVDLCFVPVSHQTEAKLPAVSGSSGRLVVERTKEEKGVPQYPGRVFEDQERDYVEVMAEFVAVSSNPEPKKVDKEAPDSLKALNQAEKQLRDERRTVREQRNQEDEAWKQLKTERKKPQIELTGQHRQSQDEPWKTLRQQRQETVEQRKQEDEQWRQKRLNLRQRWSQLPIVSAWIAVLVIVDNCSRQCLGIPLFGAGSRVTAQMVVTALQDLLPPELQFLISDRGVHFTAKVFQDLARTQEFSHVLTARHRPQSNGIAERFVRTFKEWLSDKSWHTDQDLADLLAEFLAHYNDRPHQGLDGLSPDEFARRSCLTSS
jgi:transposase InsO family protein/transposase